ncbi:MAG: protein kinase family protein [Clostridia bacterium]|nr:protein kinase family protein [Clostridia bacterium]
MDNGPLASRLLNKRVGKWNILEKRVKDKDDDSGAFSSCYLVQDDEGNKAFLKALNYQYAFSALGLSSVQALNLMTDNFLYETNLLNFCASSNMKRIVTALDHGEYKEPDEILPVPFLVFEIAEGSLKKIDHVINPDLGWKLLVFHGALVGLSQLHHSKIAHQDIKPSNVLIFGKDYSKLSDLGSATQMGNNSNWNKPLHVGDQRYIPIELAYGYCSPDWNTRRFGADLFMMGEILTLMVSGVNILSLMISSLPDIYSPFIYGGNFNDLKPILIDAHNKALLRIKNDIPTPIRKELLEIIKELTFPIPEDRGNNSKVRDMIGQYSLDRYISKIDRLSKVIKWTKKNV